MPADVFGGDAVDQDLVGVGVASAYEGGGDAAILSVADDGDAGDLAQRVDQGEAVVEVSGVQHRDRGTGLRLRYRKAGRGDNDALPDGVGLKDDILLDAGELGRVEALGGHLAKGRRGGDHQEAASRAATQGETSGRVGMRIGDDLAVLHQSYVGAYNGSAQWIGDGAMNDGRRRSGCAEKGQGETGE